MSKLEITRNGCWNPTNTAKPSQPHVCDAYVQDNAVNSRHIDGNINGNG